jgi:hypothetical protein
MKPWTVVGLLLSFVGIIVSAIGGGIAGLLLIAMLNPGVKGPHITDKQAVSAFVAGAVLGGGLAALLVAWIRKRRDA